MRGNGEGVKGTCWAPAPGVGGLLLLLLLLIIVLLTTDAWALLGLVEEGGNEEIQDLVAARHEPTKSHQTTVLHSTVLACTLVRALYGYFPNFRPP